VKPSAFQLPDVVTGLAAGVDAVGVVVGAEVVVAGTAGSDSRFQMITRMERATATRALSLLRRSTIRR
jgi:hypothetical protein